MLLNTTFDVSDYDNHEHWTGLISVFDNLGSFQRLVIEAYGSRLDVLCGVCSAYRWVFLPELKIGCIQADLNDFFWNTEQLCSILNRKDSLSIVYGLSFALSGGLIYG